MKYIISAGGTGGHIYPAISIINKIKQMDKKASFLYIGTSNRMEKDIIPKLGIKYVGIDIIGLSKNPLKLVKTLYLNVKDVKLCKTLINDFKPDIVIGVGGYVTVPVVLAAHKCHAKVLLHEQNSCVGKANKFLAKYASTICCSMKSSVSEFPVSKTVYTGNPRATDAYLSKKASLLDYQLKSDKQTVLITTGSLGASTINDVVLDMLPLIKDKSYQVLLVTGKASYEKYKDVSFKNVYITPYLENMPGVMKSVSLIVSRAGATTIAEITAIGLPSIIIPSPYVANNHQYINAKDLENNGSSVVILEKDLSVQTLLDSIDLILNSKEKYESMKTNSFNMGMRNSADLIYEEIEKLIDKED